jgi:outer membrane protein assembly factor BamB
VISTRTLTRAGRGTIGTSVCLTMLAAAAMAQPAARGWPSFRGERASGWIEEGPAPVTWDVSSGQHVRWTAPLPGRGHSSPIVVNGRVFVTAAVASAETPLPAELSADMTSSADKAKREWRLLAFDAGSGRLLWQRTARRGVPRVARHPFNTFATPTPASDGSRVIAFFGSEGLYCYDRDGRLLWSHDFGPLPAGYFGDRSFQWGFASSPVVYDGLVIVQCDVDRGSFLAAFRIADGKQVWRTERDDLSSWSTPTIAGAGDRTQLLVSAPSYVSAYDPRTGGELWRYYWGMDIVESAPIASDDLAYFSSGKGRWSPIIAIRPSARGDVTPTVFDSHENDLAWRRDTGGPITTTMLLYRGLLYALADLGVLRCYEPATGALVYERRVRGSFLASPVASDGKLYLSSLEGDVVVVEAGRAGTILASNPTGDALIATPAIAGGTLYFRTPTRLVAISGSPSSATP